MNESIKKKEEAAAGETTLTAGTAFENRYEIISLLGSGATGTVYRVTDAILNRELALKLIHKSLLSNKASIERFKQEALTGTCFDHPNLARVYSAGIAGDGRLYMVMDYLQGECLADILLREKKLSLATFFETFMQIADGLEYLHEKGIVHRDLKPKNVLFVKTGGSTKIYIVDFGLAKYIYQNGSQKNTQTGNLLGTSAYMSPEQCMGATVDARSDIYSLGCMMFECLVGTTPFSGDSPMDIMYKHLNESLGRLAFLKQVPAPLAKILSKCLQKRPEDRYENMAELKKDLLICSQMQDTLQRKLIHQSGEPASKGFRAKSAIAAASLAAIMIGVFMFCGKQKEQVSKSDDFLESQKRKHKLPLESAKTVKLLATFPYMNELLDRYGLAADAATTTPIIISRWTEQFWNSDRATFEQKVSVGKRFAEYMLRFERYEDARDWYARLENLTKLPLYRLARMTAEAQLLKKAGKLDESLALVDIIEKEYENCREKSEPILMFAMSNACDVRAECYFAMAEYEKAALAYQQALRLRRHQFKGLAGVESGATSGGLLKCYCKLGKFKEFDQLAEQLVIRTKALKTPTIKVSLTLLQVAQCAFQAASFEKSAEYYQRALEQCKIEGHPNPDIEVYIAECYLRLKKTDEGIEILKEALKRVPETQPFRHAAMAISIGKTLRETGKNQEALKILAAATTSFESSKFNNPAYLSSTADSTFANLYAQYAAALKTDNQLDKAEAMLKKVISQFTQDCPNKFTLIMEMADISYAKAQYNESVEEYAKALEFWQSKAVSEKFPGLASSDLKDLKDLTRYNSIPPLMQTERYDEAQRCCQSIMHSDNQNTSWMRVPVLNYQAKIYWKQGKFENADQAYEKLQRLAESMPDPKDSATYLNNCAEYFKHRASKARTQAVSKSENAGKK